MAAGKTGAFSIASLLADAKETKIVDSEEEGQASASGIRVELENRELWEKFSFIGNEMILTKSGRRIFPALRFLLRGLDPKASYELMVGIEPIDVKRYRYCYQRSQWIENPVPEQDDKATSSGTRIYVHPASPATGTYWMRETISFEKMKLTNNWKEDGGHVSPCIVGLMLTVMITGLMFASRSFYSQCTDTDRDYTSPVQKQEKSRTLLLMKPRSWLLLRTKIRR
jgi:hypothetical protein